MFQTTNQCIDRYIYIYSIPYYSYIIQIFFHRLPIDHVSNHQPDVRKRCVPATGPSIAREVIPSLRWQRLVWTEPKFNHSLERPGGPWSCGPFLGNSAALKISGNHLRIYPLVGEMHNSSPFPVQFHLQ